MSFAARSARQEKVKFATVYDTVLGYLQDRERTKTLRPDEAEVLHFLRHNPLASIPYEYTKEYNNQPVDIRFDAARKLHYTLMDGKKLYFNKNMTPYDITRAVRALNIEQDPRSPHRYLTPDFHITPGSVFVDVGAAEGNLSLQVVEQAKKIYLIEADPSWRTALEATFEPWKDKVTIICKYASYRNNAEEISVDKIFEQEQQIDFIKIDVEGAEEQVLNGAVNTINNSKGELKIALCTYHKQPDAERFSAKLNGLGFNVAFSYGYMLFYYNDSKQEPPYLRKGLIRAYKTNHS